MQILEAGTVSHQLIPAFRSIDYLIVIDAVEAGDATGSIFKFSPKDMNFHSEQKISLHQISLHRCVLQMAELTGAKPNSDYSLYSQKMFQRGDLNYQMKSEWQCLRLKNLFFMNSRK